MDQKALGHELYTMIQQSPIMETLKQMEEAGTISEHHAHDFYHYEWERCVEVVAEKHSLDTDTVWEAFDIYEANYL